MTAEDSLGTRRRVVAKIVGGIGNQLFCYAAARRLALRNGAELVLDVDFFRSDVNYGREFRLDAFALPPVEIRRTRRLLPERLDLRWWRLKRALGARGLLPGADWVVERDWTAFEPRLLELRPEGDVVLDGYWQDERYFADIADVLRQDLAFRLPAAPGDTEIAARMTQTAAVAVHSRRQHGATLGNPAGVTPSLSADYYRHAIREVLARVPEAHFFCFGDEPSWLARHWPEGVPVTQVHHAGPLGEIHDLRLMSLCRHFIIANSTFSWWGAWLGSAPGKLVYAPAPKGLRYEVRRADGWSEVAW